MLLSLPSWLQGLLCGPAPVLQPLQHRGAETGESLGVDSLLQVQVVSVGWEGMGMGSRNCV